MASIFRIREMLFLRIWTSIERCCLSHSKYWVAPREYRPGRFGVSAEPYGIFCMEVILRFHPDVVDVGSGVEGRGLKCRKK